MITDLPTDTVDLPRRLMLGRFAAAMAAYSGTGRDGLSEDGLSSVRQDSAFSPHRPPQARQLIWLTMNGGPSQVDTWDHKPELTRRDGQTVDHFDRETGFFPNSVGPLMRSPFQFRQWGQSGTWVSEIFPHLARCVDHMAFLHACWSQSNNHSPALFQINTGSFRQGFPALGAWLSWRLGTDSRALPAFVVLTDATGRGRPKGGALNWGSGFMPTAHQGVALADPADWLDAVSATSPLRDQQRLVQLVDQLNALHRAGRAERLAESARRLAREQALQLQSRAPHLLDLGSETRSTQQAYGLDNPTSASFGRQCLFARRLIEAGVRCVQIYSGGTENEQSWDAHRDLATNHRQLARETDQPIAALLTDLHLRGLLDSTLVLWSGEFGRLPMVQRGGTGRDHNPHAFTAWLAGGGVKGGHHHGATDELGLKGVEGRVSIPDLHATILHLMGLDHRKVTYRFNSRDVRLTDVSGEVIQPILA